LDIQNASKNRLYPCRSPTVGMLVNHLSE
jgi:hypothetical protein